MMSTLRTSDRSGRNSVFARFVASVARDPRTLLLNVVIGLLTVIVGFLAYALLTRFVFRPPVDTERAGMTAGKGVIQLDVLNGCGVSGAANRITGYLRARGYDVVELRNYKTFDVQESLVIDRTGNLQNAERVAYALGIPRENIVQQISPDYYVDVSVVVGKNYQSLKPSQ